MARRSRRITVSSNLSLLSGADLRVSCAEWLGKAQSNAKSARLLLGKAAEHSADGPLRVGILQLLSYNLKDGLLSEVDLLRVESVPVSMAVHPSGANVMVSFSNDCKCFDFATDKPQIKMSDTVSVLKDVGPQRCLAFSPDGSKLAMGGEDGHLRVYEWPRLQLVLDQPKAHKSFKDLDFSLDSAFLSSIANSGPARVWDVLKYTHLTNLTCEQGEMIDFCRFSRDGTKPFLFVTVTKDGKGTVVVWDMSTWKRLGYKKFIDCPISAFDISHDGKFLAIGSNEGNICIIEVQKMEARYSIRRAHIGAVIISLEFSPNSRSLLSISPDWALKVHSLPGGWKDWQIYAILLALVLISAILFLIFFEHSDSFWNFPLGRNQPAKPPIEAILGDPVSSDETNMW